MKINIRIIAAIILVSVCGSLVFGAASTETAENSLTQKLNSSLEKKMSPETELADKNLGQSLYRMMLSLAVVIALAIGAMYVSKKVLPKVSGISGKRVQVLESISLGSRRSVHLIAIGERQILIGSTQTTITRLAELPVEATGSDDIDQSKEGDQ